MPDFPNRHAAQCSSANYAPYLVRGKNDCILLRPAIWLSTPLVLGWPSRLGLEVVSACAPAIPPEIYERREEMQSPMQVVAAYIGSCLPSPASLCGKTRRSGNGSASEAASASELYRNLTIYGSEADPARRN